jgi:hypothetical protein
MTKGINNWKIYYTFAKAMAKYWNLNIIGAISWYNFLREQLIITHISLSYCILTKVSILERKKNLVNFYNGGIILFIKVSVPVEYFRMKNCTSFTFNENLFAKMKNAGQ